MEQNLSPTGFGVEHTRHVGCGAKPDCDGVEDVLFAVVPKAISSIDNSLITGVLTSFVSSSFTPQINNPVSYTHLTLPTNREV